MEGRDGTRDGADGRVRFQVSTSFLPSFLASFLTDHHSRYRGDELDVMNCYGFVYRGGELEDHRSHYRCVELELEDEPLPLRV
jgi:hypothetical protein